VAGFPIGISGRDQAGAIFATVDLVGAVDWQFNVRLWDMAAILGHFMGSSSLPVAATGRKRSGGTPRSPLLSLQRVPKSAVLQAVRKPNAHVRPASKTARRRKKLRRHE
jgi:hypothetical protein